MSSAPSYAGSRSSDFDAPRSIYNLTGASQAQLRAAFGRAASGGTGRIAFVGDSLTAGNGSGTTPGSTDPVAALGHKLRELGYKVGERVHLFNNMTPDVRMSASGGGWPGTGANLPTTQNPWPCFQSTGGTLTVTGSGDTIEIIGLSYFAGWHYSVDGGSTSTFTPAGGASPVPQSVTITGLADGEHTVTITSISGTTSGNPAYLYAVEFRHSAGGVVLDNAGISGATCADWLATNGPLSSLLNSPHVPDVTVCEIGYNDTVNPTLNAALPANQASLISQIQGAGSAVLLVAPNPNSNSVWLVSDSQAYVSLCYDTADATGLPLLDLMDVFGDYDANVVTFGLAAGDGIHFNAAGYDTKADRLLGYLGQPVADQSNTLVAARVHASTGQTITTSGPNTVTLGGTSYNHGMAIVSNGITAPYDGLYQVCVRGWFQSTVGTGDALRDLLLVKNGTTYCEFEGFVSGGDELRLTGTDLIELDAGDVLTLSAYQTGPIADLGGGSLPTLTSLALTLVGRT